KLVSPRARLIMRVLVSVIGSVICFYLARAFWAAVLINGEETPAEYDVLTDQGSVHLCDASREQLAEGSRDRSAIFCAVHGFFQLLGVKMQTPGAAFQLIVPV